MREEVVIVTGANGEVGHGLITYLAEHTEVKIVAMDIQPLDESLNPYCYEFVLGDVLDAMLLGRLILKYEIRAIYHLASILSTRAEYNPEQAHRVNVEGTLNLLHLAVEQSQWQGRPVKFLYPSSIAVYGVPDLETKARVGAVKEYEWTNPTTMYGCNKLYCEQLGRYYANHYQQLAADRSDNLVDFRCVRYPGLVSAFTIPTGGTSDYGPEMLHHAAQNLPYDCFVRETSCLPFMAMPDAVKALVNLAEAPREALSRHVYNVTSFSLTAEDFFNHVREAFPQAQVQFKPDKKRQAIVDTWPGAINDSAAAKDWGWKPDFDEQRSFKEYLVPNIAKRYG